MLVFYDYPLQLPLQRRCTIRVTNKLGLPLPLVKAVSQPPRRLGPNTISVTELIGPVQIRALRLKYEDQLEEDASERIWALLGTLFHAVLESHAEGLEKTIAEQRLSIEVDGWTITGKYDLSEMVLEGEELTDWKLTSIYSLKDNDKPEWTAQVNVYAYLITQHGRPVLKAQIVPIGRDWSKMRAMRDKEYPQKPVIIKPVSLWTSENTLAYIRQRLALHIAAEKGDVAECTPEERWAKETQWALMKRGQKRAVKLFDSWKAAEAHRGAANYIVERPGESTRCLHYCSVSSVCPQCARIKEQSENLSDKLEESIKVAKQQKEKT